MQKERKNEEKKKTKTAERRCGRKRMTSVENRKGRDGEERKKKRKRKRKKKKKRAREEGGTALRAETKR